MSSPTPPPATPDPLAALRAGIERGRRAQQAVDEALEQHRREQAETEQPPRAGE